MYRFVIRKTKSGTYDSETWTATEQMGIVDLQYNQSFGTIFFLGYAKLFVDFCRRFLAGGAGKNGSSVALGGFLEHRVSMTIAGSLLGVYIFQSNLRIILTGGVGKNGSSIAGTSVLSPVIPLSLVVVPAFIIWRKSEQNLYETNPCLYVLAFGLVAAKVTNRLVVAHMTKNEMEYFDSSLFGPSMLFLNQYFNCFFPEIIVLWLCVIYVTADLLWYSALVCNEICESMHIELFRITPKENTQHGSRNGTPANTTSSPSDKDNLD